MRAILALPLVLVLAGCGSNPATARRTVGIGSDGSVVGETRSALNGSTEGGPQEIAAFYLPFGPFAVKAGLTWDGNPLIVNPVVPVPLGAAPMGACAAPLQTQMQTVMVPETYMETETRQVPRTRMVPRQVAVPVVPVPLPKAAPNPCGQPEPVSQVGCEDGCCRIAAR